MLLALGSQTLGNDDDWQPLYQRVDANLQQQLDAQVTAHPTWKRLVERKKMGFCVVDLSTEPPQFARINGNVMMYAASLPKIAILLGAYEAFESGRLAETAVLRRDLDAMIRVSSNAAATRMIDVVGMAHIQAVLRDPKYGLYDRQRGGGLWVGKRYAKTGPRVGDPIHGISHGATPTQVCRFYYLLASGKLLSPQRSAQMLSHLEDPALHHKFVAELDKRAPKAKKYRKSGTWRNYHSDSVLVRGVNWRDYILVGLIEADGGDKILQEILSAVESILSNNE
jgi:beta-lactamase class A